jgi:hypothetical protein
LQGLATGFEHFEAPAARRLYEALRLLGAPGLADRIEDGSALRTEVAALYPTAVHLGRVMGAVPPLLRAHRTVITVFQKLEGREQDERWRRAILRAASRLHQQLQDLSWKIGAAVRYPFDHAESSMTVARHALPKVPDSDDVGDLLEVADDAVQKLASLYNRLVGRLVLAADRVEAALGLPPLMGEEEGGAS